MILKRGAAVLVISALVLLVTAAIREPSDGEALDVELWPAFTATYDVVEVSPEGTDGAERLVERRTTVRLDYRGRADWVKTVLADSVEPAMAGSTQRYTGTELIEDLPDIGLRTLPQNPREVLAPEWWLADWASAPDYDARDLNESQREYVWETTETCSSRALCGQSFGTSVVSRERIVVDTATRVPVLIERTLGEMVVLRVEVRDLASLP